uniref:Large ribosomal subunit protein eL37 n=1 Tax=uncultured korarchaeote TaxID=161241 RepID=A0A1L2JT43_9CREN|nr:ribosomal protein L37E [uncultured korarchaeote]
MVKGTPSMGKRSKGRTHIRCRRCGRHAYHVTRRVCAACGYGRLKRIRKYRWQNKDTLTRRRLW